MAKQLQRADRLRAPPVVGRSTLRRMRCSLSHAEWGHPDAETVQKMNEAFSGQQCRTGKRGFVCPHKQFPLGSIKAIDGVVTCPLHGLRIDAATGKCLGTAGRHLDGVLHDAMPQADGRGRG